MEKAGHGVREVSVQQNGKKSLTVAAFFGEQRMGRVKKRRRRREGEGVKKVLLQQQADVESPYWKDLKHQQAEIANRNKKGGENADNSTHNNNNKK